jgi:hypothetical protein
MRATTTVLTHHAHVGHSHHRPPLSSPSAPSHQTRSRGWPALATRLSRSWLRLPTPCPAWLPTASTASWLAGQGRGRGLIQCSTPPVSTDPVSTTAIAIFNSQFLSFALVGVDFIFLYCGCSSIITSLDLIIAASFSALRHLQKLEVHAVLFLSFLLMVPG